MDRPADLLHPTSGRPARRAFTLVELIVVLIVLAVLGVMVAGTFQATVGRSDQAAAEQTVVSVARQAQTLATVDRDTAAAQLPVVLADIGSRPGTALHANAATGLLAVTTARSHCTTTVADGTAAPDVACVDRMSRAFAAGFGDHTDGQHGTGATGGSTAGPVDQSDGTAWTHMTAGNRYACGIDLQQLGWCWGANADGRLGSGGLLATVTSRPTPIAGGHRWAALSAGNAHACGVDTTGDAWCWGESASTKSGTGIAAARFTTPTAVAGGHTFTAISAGTTHTCALDDAGRVWCWGYNTLGQLGNGGTTDSNVPVAVTGSRTYTSVSAGPTHTCSVDTAGALHCWGEGTYGKLGNGDTTNRSVPTAVAGGGQHVTVTAGWRHTCAIRTDGTGWCFGRGVDGALGTATSQANTPVPVGGGHRWAALTAGQRHTCGIDTTGAGWCFGRNDRGQLGRPAAVGSSATPTAVQGGHTWQQLQPSTQQMFTVGRYG